MLNQKEKQDKTGYHYLWGKSVETRFLISPRFQERHSSTRVRRPGCLFKKLTLVGIYCRRRDTRNTGTPGKPIDR